MNLLKRIGKAFFGDSNDEETTLSTSKPLRAKPKPPRKGKLTYRGKSLEQTKNIIHNQKLKSSEDFNKMVDDFTIWIDDTITFYIATAWSEGDIWHTVGKLNKKELSALRVAMSKYPYSYPSNSFDGMVFSQINDAVQQHGHQYVLRKGKQ